jgi:Kef-type K+ transport system membrane component KefB/mannitol/fructose-specific phosphotransferase system IIA component (Ntr-type)
MHYLDESHIFLFLVQVSTLLVTAKVLGAVCQKRGVPAVAGEILAGILLGPTILGRTFPSLHEFLFPAEVVQVTMLDTVSWFGVLFLLLATGFEISISTVWKQGKSSLVIGAVGVLIPFLIGCAVFSWLPEAYWGAKTNRLTFALFLATAAAISAIPVIAKILHDLDILKSDFGLITLSAFIVNDVLGWLAFTLVLGLALGTGASGWSTARVFLEILLFGAVCLTIGSKVIGAITTRLQRSSLPQPGTTLSFICALGLLCGAITQWIGVHAILGFFLAGIMAGNAPEISERMRQTISQMIYAIFVPIFFATIGLKVDFLANIDLLLLVTVTAVAVGGKYLGAWAGGRLAKLSKPDSLSIGIAHIPGGAMEIVIGILALELELIPENVFVALVFAALSSSVAVGPLLAWSIRRRAVVDVRKLLLRDAVMLELSGTTRWEVIDELCARVVAAADDVDGKTLVETVRARESVMGTGIEQGVAVPHGRLAGLRRPMVAFGLSRTGIDWDAPDGLTTHLVFLILTPEQEGGMQVQILASIATAMAQNGTRSKLISVETEHEAIELLDSILSLPASGPDKSRET